jgi:hypothetical protein
VATILAVLLGLMGSSTWASLDARGVDARGESSPQSRDPLLGTWDTGRVSFDRVRAAMSAAGYTEPEIRFFLRDNGLRAATTWRLDLTFTREHGVPSVIRTGWDPALSATPVDGEHARYRLLPRRRIAITSADPKFHKWRELYSYRITGKRLRFRVIGETDPTLTKEELRLDRRGMYAMAAAPLKKIG